MYIHTSTSTSTMVATLAIDHTITHDLPPSLSLPLSCPQGEAREQDGRVLLPIVTHTQHMYIYIHIHICCTTSSAQPTYWHVVQTCLHSHPSIIIMITRKTPRELFDDEKDLWNYVHVHDMYISLVWGRSLIYPHVCSMSSICQYNTWRIIGPVIIMRSTLTGRYFYRIQYLIHHATSIAMTSYLLALASIPYIGRCHSALEVESVHTCTSSAR